MIATKRPRQSTFRFGSPEPIRRVVDAVLRERETVPDVAGRLDREQRVIRNVKLLGLESVNGRRYTDECLREAVALYEGARVYDGHMEESDDQDRAPHDRPIEDWLGVIRNVRFVESEGLYGDFHYLESNSASGIILEAAERFPDRLGFSPHHFARHDLVSNEVTKILRVYSIDLVRQPATVAGLFESDRQPTGGSMKRKIRDIVAATPAGTAGLSVLSDMLESDSAIAEMDVPVGAAADPGADLAAAFAAAVAAVMSSSEPIDAKKAKLLALLKAQEQVTAAPETKTAETEEADGGELQVPETDEKESDQTGKLSKRLAALEAENAQHVAREEVRALFESAKVTPSPVQLKAAMALQGDERKAFVTETAEAIRESADDGIGLPRSGPKAKPHDGGQPLTGYPTFAAGELARSLR